MPQFVRLYAQKLLQKIESSSNGKKANLLFGLNSLKVKYGVNRLNIACARALELGVDDYQVLKKLLEDQQELAPTDQIVDQELLNFMYESGYLRDQKQFEELAEQALC